jgi:hypothetical protein
VERGDLLCLFVAALESSVPLEALRATLRERVADVRCALLTERAPDGGARYVAVVDCEQFPGVRAWTDAWPRIWDALRSAHRDGVALVPSHESPPPRARDPEPSC